MLKIIYSLMISALVSFSAYAEQTAPGKIIYTEGHYAPSCRTAKHKENGTGIEKVFRIADVSSDDDIGAVVLSALIANRDVTINYDPSQLSGCGSEPKIQYITIF